jgi:beta-ureidopropionase / N-carbamoyl-L-amino-acid hydrolase
MSNEFGLIARHVDAERLWQRHVELARFGATEKGGVNRAALSREEIAARAELVRWGAALGLEASVDAVANLFLKLLGREPALAPMLIGSHIDSQPTGGKFDGSFGVLAALESAEAIIAAGLRPRRTIEIVSWTNEEGSRFAPGMMGSAVFTGMRRLDDIRGIKDKSGVTLAAALNEVLAAAADLPRRALGGPAAGYLEGHIEQGPILEQEGKRIGIVTGMQGKRTMRVEIEGEEAHAGTTPRSHRRDALVSAVDLVQALEKAVADDEDVTRFTIGMFNVAPNAPSVVPARVVFSIDLRHPDAQTLVRLGDAVAKICHDAAGRCKVAVRELLHEPPLEFPHAVRDRLAAAATALRIPWRDIASGAGHDARYLHYFCPSGMIFIPCKHGVSHNEAESATKDDIAAGARVLAETVFAMADA